MFDLHVKYKWNIAIVFLFYTRKLHNSLKRNDSQFLKCVTKYIYVLSYFDFIDIIILLIITHYGIKYTLKLHDLN